ncbi:tripartite motif-containing protein 40 [Biomphalaria glabrata]|nr:tripartite motif-containing protein 40 [Biomphalaria glabrata]
MSRYNVSSFLPVPDEELLCGICMNILDKPLETPCRHVFCTDCIHKAVREQSKCPLCRKKCKKSMLKDVLPLVQNLINKLTMKCPNYDNGCITPIKMEYYYDHLVKCEYSVVKCQYKECSAHMLRKEIVEHEQNDCIYRHKMCTKGCGLMLSTFQEEKHECVTALVELVKELKEDKANMQKTIDEMKTKISVLHHEISPALSSSSSELSSISSTFHWSTTSDDWSDLDIQSLNSEVLEHLSTSGHDSDQSLEEPSLEFLSSTGGNVENETTQSLPGDNSLAEVDAASQSIATSVNGNNKRSQDYDNLLVFKRAKPSSAGEEGPSTSSALPVAKLNSLRSQTSKNSVASHEAGVSSATKKKGTGKRHNSHSKSEPFGAGVEEESPGAQVSDLPSSSGGAAGRSHILFHHKVYFGPGGEEKHQKPHYSIIHTDSGSSSSVTTKATNKQVEAEDDAKTKVTVSQSTNNTATCSESTSGLSDNNTARELRSSTRTPHTRSTRSSTRVQTRSSVKLLDKLVPLDEDVIPNVKVPPTAAYLLNKYTEEDSSEDESWSPSEAD